MRRRVVGVVLALLMGVIPAGVQEIYQERQGVLERDVTQLKTFLTTP